jgi:hypothetical protein
LLFRHGKGEWSGLKGRDEVLGTAFLQKQNFEVKLVSTGSYEIECETKLHLE